MKPEEAKVKSEVPTAPEPTTTRPVQKTDGHTGPYWDALRKLPRVRVGAIGAGLIFSPRPPANESSNKE
jgi:hypothetical protein